MEFCFRSLSAEDAAIISSWRYCPPFDFYNHASAAGTGVTELLRPEYNYHAIDNRAGEFIGFFCLGADAQVPGWKYDSDALDLGMGLAPHLTGQGIGRRCLQAILKYVDSRGFGRTVRATIVAWNRRAIRLCQGAGFRETASFKAPSGHWFKVLVRSSG